MRVLLVDWTENKPVGWSWKIGAFLFRRRFDLVIKAKSWESALAEMSQRCPPEGFKYLEFWGHGAPGLLFIAQEHAKSKQIQDLGYMMSRGGNIWLRTCAAMSGVWGYNFSKALANWSKCTVWGHTHGIGFFHSGLVGLAPGMKPYWSLGEGVGADGEMLWSKWDAPRTNMFWAGSETLAQDTVFKLNKTRQKALDKSVVKR